jgi:glucose-1-phosphate thymidylyltransferase
MRGIVLAGGSGTRLHPLTIPTSKQLLPVYDKPMIYYPLSTLMLAGIREILVITTPHELNQFERLLGDGSQWGVSIKFVTQASPGGLAQALILGEDFIGQDPVALILGDNIFFGAGMGMSLSRVRERHGATIFAYEVDEPSSFGVVEFDSQGEILSIEEKPASPKSNFIVPGLYFYDSNAPELAKTLRPSSRGELEITDLNMLYLERKELKVEILDQSQEWLDTGTIDTMHQAAVRVFEIEKNLGMKINVPEEVAWRKGYISTEKLMLRATEYPTSGYGDYLLGLINAADAIG